MAEKHEKCPDCGTPLWDLERRLEMADRSHRHHAVDCVVVLKERVNPRIEVHVVGTPDEPLSIAKLMVNGFGVASWRAWSLVGNTGSTGKDYAEECARVLRKALGVVVETKESSA
jgi:hypothetical protein